MTQSLRSMTWAPVTRATPLFAYLSVQFPAPSKNHHSFLSALDLNSYCHRKFLCVSNYATSRCCLSLRQLSANKKSSWFLSSPCISQYHHSRKQTTQAFQSNLGERDYPPFLPGGDHFVLCSKSAVNQAIKYGPTVMVTCKMDGCTCAPTIWMWGHQNPVYSKLP